MLWGAAVTGSVQFRDIWVSCQAGTRSVVVLALCQQQVCARLSLAKCEVARSTFTDANSSSGLYPAAQVVSGRQLLPGESLPCLIL